MLATIIIILVVIVAIVAIVWAYIRFMKKSSTVMLGRRVGYGGGNQSMVMINTQYGRMVRNRCDPADQKGCNACWAVSTAQTMSDRLRNESLISPNDELNYYDFNDMIAEHHPQMANCQEGAYLDTGMKMSTEVGIPLMSETIDRNFDNTVIASDEGVRRFRTRNWRQLMDGSVNATIGNIKRELETNGSVIGVINLYPSFMNHVGTGVYRPLPSETTDASMVHMVSIVGYNDKDSSWIIRNSYGPSFGFNGFGKIRQGDPKIDIESYVYAPDI